MMALMMALMMASAAIAQNYPEGPADPAYQLEGYTLNVEDFFKERIRPWRSWAIADVMDLVNSVVSQKESNMTAVQAWGGWAIRWEIDTAWFPGWYYAAGVRMWWWTLDSPPGEGEGPGT